MACTPRPGDQLKELRNHLGITTREVEELSRRLAERTVQRGVLHLERVADAAGKQGFSPQHL
jgi:hypothetical protein